MFLKDEKASAYAWLTFFVFLWIFATIWFFALNPLWEFSLDTASFNNFVSLPGAEAFYVFFATVYNWITFLMLIFAVIGFLKYASSIKRRWY